MVKPDAQTRDLKWVHGKLRGLVFNSGCQSWWMDSVTKKNTFIYPDPMFKYWLRTIFPKWTDFEITKDSRANGMSDWLSYVWLATSLGVLATVVAMSSKKGFAREASSYLNSVSIAVKSILLSAWK